MSGILGQTSSLIARYRGMLVPTAAAALVLVVLVPLPPGVMDVLLAANVALAAVILLTALHVRSPLEFSVFPSVLLGATLLRLVLNVATTRLILTAGADGRGLQEARLAAGNVVWSFSRFVASGSLAVGVILFLIILVIQFVVITRGATRISEVAARFMLDAMPGKQMAIDADLTAGLIGQEEARQRRRLIARESDFYGAMDGASKFVRGDAVAALIITAINMLGGFYVGLVEYGWNWPQTTALFTRLTIGDGLVTQVPAFIVSIAAAVLVSRSTVRTDLGEEVVKQLTARPVALGTTAAMLGVLMLTSLPKLPLLLLAGALAGLAFVLRRGRGGRDDAGGEDADHESAAAAPVEEPLPSPRPAHTLEDLPAVDAVRVEIGFALVRMVDPQQGGDLLDRIASLRRQIARELGFVVPAVRVCDDIHLEAHQYVIRLRGAPCGEGRLYAGRLLAVPAREGCQRVLGIETVEPAFGAPAVWIAPDERARAEQLGYTVVEPAGVLMTHLGETVRSRAADILSRQQVVRMLERLESEHEALVAEARAKVGPGRICRVLGELLAEGVSIRDLETILEALCEAVAAGGAGEQLAESVRKRLAPSLARQYCGPAGKLWCVCLDRHAEDVLDERLENTGAGTVLAVGPDTAGKVSHAVGEAMGQLRRGGRRPVLVCRPRLRKPLRDLLAATQPDAAVLGYNEIDSVQVEAVATVGLEP